MDIKNKILRRLAFVYVVETRSFTKASEIIQVSKSAISKYVSELEDELGSTLLNRSTRNMVITDEGNLLYQSFRPIVDHLENAESFLTENIGDIRGDLRVTYPESISIIVEKTIGRMIKKYPQLNIYLIKEDQRINIIENKIDCAISVGQLKDSSLMAQKVGNLSEVIVGHKDIFKKINNPAKDFGDLPYINNNWEGNYLDIVSNDKKIRVKKNIKLNVSSLQSVIQFIKEGSGIGRIPAFCFRNILDDNYIDLLDPNYKILSVPVYLVHPFKFLPKKIIFFKEELLSVWKEL